ncbi:hypothetical protein Tco_0699768 [Tanacetum coccineum]
MVDLVNDVCEYVYLLQVSLVKHVIRSGEKKCVYERQVSIVDDSLVDIGEIACEEKRLRLEEEKMFRLEEEKMLQIAEVNKRKRYEFMNSTHVKNILGNFPPIKRNDAHSVTCKAKPKESWVKIKKYRQNVNDPSLAELLKKVKPWVEDVSRLFHSMDTIWLSDDIERFISQPGQLKSMFTWSDDYTIYRNSLALD